jgi:hypothetical protein
VKRLIPSLLFLTLVAVTMNGCGPSPPPTATPLVPSPIPPSPPTIPVAATLPLPSPTPAPAMPTATEPVASPTEVPQPVTTPSATPLSTAPEERWEVRTFLAGPGEPGRLYVLLADLASRPSPAMRVRFLISDDYGDTWYPFPGGLPAEDCVINVNLDYATPDALYASTCQGLHRWSGSEWTLISPQETGMVAVVYGQPEVMWATGSFRTGAAVLRSNDGGVTWTPAGDGLISFNGVANVAIDPRDANTLYAIIWPKYAGSYLRRGTASGQWTTMPTPLDNSTINVGMTIDGATGALYVTVTTPSYQLWRTLNPNTPDLNDVRWELVHDFGRDVMVDLLASGWSPEGLALYANFWPLDWKDAGFAEVGEAVFRRSLDGGQTWIPLPVP